MFQRKAKSKLLFQHGFNQLVRYFTMNKVRVFQFFLVHNIFGILAFYFTYVKYNNFPIFLNLLQRFWSDYSNSKSNISIKLAIHPAGAIYILDLIYQSGTAIPSDISKRRGWSQSNETFCNPYFSSLRFKY